MGAIRPTATMDIETEELLFRPSERGLRTPSKHNIHEDIRGAARKIGYRLGFSRSRSRTTVHVYMVVLEEKTEITASGFFDLDKDSPLYADMEDILEREQNNQLRLHSYADVWNE